MIRRIVIAVIAAAGLLAPLTVVTPASAGSGVGCSGNDCWASLSQMIVLGGDHSGGGSQPQIPLPPPPCLWNPIGDQTSGSNYIIKFFNGQDPGAGSPYQTHDAYLQAKDLLKHPVAGTWYVLPVNPNASPAAQAECLKLPLFAFAPRGQAPPIVPVPPRELALYAFNDLPLNAPALTTNPKNPTAYVNLATYVWANWQASTMARRPGDYEVTATLGNESVSVYAHLVSFHIAVTGRGTPAENCGPTGSHEPVDNPPANSGAGMPPDCGVLWRGPDANAAVSARIVWRITWGQGILAGPGPNTLRAALSLTGGATALTVKEIQSVNGG